jgi:hypothetical protein
MRREERGVSPTVEWVDSPIQFSKSYVALAGRTEKFSG